MWLLEPRHAFATDNIARILVMILERFVFQNVWKFIVFVTIAIGIAFCILQYIVFISVLIAILKSWKIRITFQYFNILFLKYILYILKDLLAKKKCLYMYTAK